MVFFQGKRLQLNFFNNSQMFVKKFIVNNMNAPYKWNIIELKENCVHVIHGFINNQPRSYVWLPPA